MRRRRGPPVDRGPVVVVVVVFIDVSYLWPMVSGLLVRGCWLLPLAFDSMPIYGTGLTRPTRSMAPHIVLHYSPKTVLHHPYHGTPKIVSVSFCRFLLSGGLGLCELAASLDAARSVPVRTVF